MTCKCVGGVGNANFSHSPLAEGNESVIDGTRIGADETLEGRGVARGRAGVIFKGSGRFFSAFEGRDWVGLGQSRVTVVIGR